MKYYCEVKIMGDGYPSGFTNGMSMCNSESTHGFQQVEETEDATIFENDRQHRMILHHVKRGQATEYTTEFINNSDKEVTLEMLSSFAVREIYADKIYRMQSFWSAEGKLRVETVTDLHLEVSWNRCATRVEKFGNVGSMPVRKYFPFMALENSKEGTFWAVQLYSPSSWQMELWCREGEFLNAAGGIADRETGHWLKTVKPGESFTTPKAVITEGKTLYEACDKLVKAQKPDIAACDLDMGIMFNEYCTTWGNPTFDNVKKIADKLKGKGIQYLVIDSGWYGTGDWWWTSIGDWEVNQERFAGGMKPIADYIRSCGMIPGLWYEFEALNSGSKHYNDIEHLVKKDGVPLNVAGRHFWDMEDPWVIDYLSEKVIKLLKDCGFGYLKVDYNDTLGMGCDGPETTGENLRRKVLASQAFFRKIKEEIPDIVIENCSSGGHRLEPSMMELVSQASFSDAHEIPSIPLIAANLHRVIRPEQSQIWAVLRASDSDNRIYYSLVNTFLGRMCLSGDIYELSDHQWKLVEEGMAFYRKAAEIIRDGMTVKCENTADSYNHPAGEQLLIRTLGDRSLAICHRFENSVMPDLSFLDGKEVLAQYGSLEEDFSAKAWIFR